MLQPADISGHEGDLLGPRPSFELSLATNCVDWKHRTVDVDEPDGGMVMRRLAAETKLLLSDALSNVAGLANVEGSVRGLEYVDGNATIDRVRAGYLAKHLT